MSLGTDPTPESLPGVVRPVRLDWIGCYGGTRPDDDSLTGRPSSRPGSVRQVSTDVSGSHSTTIT